MKNIYFYQHKLLVTFERIDMGMSGVEIAGGLFGSSNFEGEIPQKHIKKLEALAAVNGFTIKVISKEASSYRDKYEACQDWYLRIRRCENNNNDEGEKTVD